MTPETFFEKFDQFADSPNAVAKMRELVLQMAVRGKLVEPAAEPETHLAWLAFRKEISERIYSYDPGPSPPFEIPDHWEWCVLDEVADCRASAKISPASIGDKDWVLDLEDIDGTTGKIVQFATFAERRSLSTKAAFAPGDVLYGKLRPYLNKVVVAPKSGFCTTEIIPLRPEAFLLPEFLRFYLRSQTFLRYTAQKNYGMKMPRLGTKDLEAAEIPVPPPFEQKRIVAKVDELMALCDRLEAQQQERETRHASLARASLARFADAPTPANLPFLFHPSYAIPPADLRKSILTLAVQGKLVPQDPNDEPAEVLLERVKAAREALVVERSVRQSDEIEYSLPDEADDAPPGWVGVHVNDVAIVQGGKRLPNGAVFSESPTPHVYIRVTDMKNGTISEIGLRYISPEVHCEIARYIINKEDLYITIAGTIGDVGCVPESLDGHNLTENAAKIVFRGFDRRFFQLTLTSEFVQAQFLEKTKQMAQPKLALKRIAGAKFYLPPLAEQRRIVAKVEQLMALVDALETQLAASRATAANLLEALVAELTA